GDSMSTFFRALEQAERERAQKERARHTETETPVSAPRAEHEDNGTTPEPAPSTAARIERAAETPAYAPPPKETRDAPTSPVFWKEGEDHVVSLLEPASFEAEQYRTLRHTVEQLHRSAALSVFAVSSPAGGDGKTLTSINLAGSLAQAHDARVLLVDVDLRHA